MEQQIDPDEENRLSRLMHQVFDVELLREMIIDSVIREGNVISYSSVKTCRLVHKSWLHTVSKLLRKTHNYLFSLYLHDYNSLEKFTQQGKNMLDQYLSTSLSKTSPTFMDDHIPPFAIKAYEEFFEEENYTIFSDVLFKCGSGLVEMNLEISTDGGSMPFIFPFSPQLTLPNLTKFTVWFDGGDGTDGSNAFNATTVHLIQSILSASHNSLKLFDVSLTESDTIPSGMGYLRLPVSLTTLELSYPMKNKDLNILLKNRLPNLKDLSLLIPKTGFKDGLISQVLAPFCEKLENLTFDVVHPTDDDVFGITVRPTYFKLPAVMKNLKKITIRPYYVELENGLKSLETSLPEMKHLVLTDQTVPVFRKWMDNSKFENVTELRMSLVHANDENYYINMDVEIMQCLHLAFPNLRVLNIAVCGSDMSGLEYLLLEMKQLEELEIQVGVLGRMEHLANSDFWDSLLIGVQLEVATAMRTLPDFWETFEIKDATRPSIRNLSELRTLKILNEIWPTRLDNVSLISDAVFHFGFFKMPNLTELELCGKFSASMEMKSKWMSKPGRRITS